MTALCASLLVACSFAPGTSSGTGDAGPGHDADPGADARDAGPHDAPRGSADAMSDAPADTFAPLHVGSADRAPGTADLALSADVDTDALTYGSASVPGVTFALAASTSGGPMLAILHVRAFSVAAGSHPNVRGSHPLVVIASGDITIDGVLDASASGKRPGASGDAPPTGAGGAADGRPGANAMTYYDSGGGGGGFATAGAIGGDSSCTDMCGVDVPGGAGGALAGDANVSVLVGGGAGGSTVTQSAACADSAGGAGGGAIQLSTPGAITIANKGAVLAGGAGGTGGGACTSTGHNWGAGAGGGAGGAIVLQGGRVVNDGAVAANGGAGGGGAGAGTDGANGKGLKGNKGEDGGATTSPAAPGASVGDYSSAGGAGGTSIAPGAGTTNTFGEGNGGGGGGAAGRIVVVSTMKSGAGIYSPGL